jgi:DnaJ-class molecular chaperone
VKKNLYDILGVARDADADTIRKAYRKLAREHHPDVNPGDDEAEERFKEISQAYSVLSDAEKRSQYDEFGEAALEGGFDAGAARRAREAFGARFGGPEFEGSAGEFHFGDLDDLLGGVFSRFGRDGGRPPRPRRGRDLEASITLEFLDAARGGEHRLSLARPSAEGGVAQEQITVRTPAGVRDGGRIRLAGKGGETAGGSPGDLYLNVHVRPHAVFRREDRDVHLEVPISVSEAVRGAKVEIPTLDGRATVTIPSGTDSGKKLRLRGKGLANPAGGAPGDLIATLRIRVPQDMDEAAEKALDEISRHDPPDLREELFR